MTSSSGASVREANNRIGFRRFIGVGMAAAFVTAAIAVQWPALAFAKTVQVKMSDTPPKYIPATAKIKVGDTIEWTNNALTLHDVNANPANAQDKGDVVLPSGVQPFDSGFMPPGKTFSHTFKTPGTYKYFCLPHEKDGMTGKVIVTN